MELETEIEEKIKTKDDPKDEIIEPKRFKVILLNDDYTTMDFVIEVLMQIFNKPFDEAVNIMLHVHRQGRGVCGVYPYDIAETKVEQVKTKARLSGFPLRAILEEA